MTSWTPGWWAETEECDLGYAREKLDSLLQTLKENPEKTKHSSKYRDENFPRKDLTDKEKYRSPFLSAKNISDIKRKKRRTLSDEEDNVKESFVIKVFERSVDFGQFSENAPLYPMARAWIRNLNQGDASTWHDVPGLDEDQEASDSLCMRRASYR